MACWIYRITRWEPDPGGQLDPAHRVACCAIATLITFRTSAPPSVDRSLAAFARNSCQQRRTRVAGHVEVVPPQRAIQPRRVGTELLCADRHRTTEPEPNAETALQLRFEHRRRGKEAAQAHPPAAVRARGRCARPHGVHARCCKSRGLDGVERAPPGCTPGACRLSSRSRQPCRTGRRPSGRNPSGNRRSRSGGSAPSAAESRSAPSASSCTRSRTCAGRRCPAG